VAHTVHAGRISSMLIRGRRVVLTWLWAKSLMESSTTRRVMETGRVRSDLEPWMLSTSNDELLGNGLLGAAIPGKLLKTIEWPAAAWIYSVTCAEKKTPELDAIKFARRTLR
jgi:hypothetical protein